MDYSNCSIYSDACLVFIVTGLVCAAVRWFHMCRPYDREEKYFYPARRQVTFYYAAIALMEIPYYLNPMADGVFDYVRILGIVFYPLCFTQMFLRYFRWKKLDTVSEYAGFSLVMVFLAVLLAAASVCPSFLHGHSGWLLAAGGVVSILLTIRLVNVLLWIYRQIDAYHRENFSSEKDFPYRFAENVIWLPAAWICLEWLVFLFGSRDLKAVGDIMFTVGMAGFLCLILHPHRILQSEELSAAADVLEETEEQVMEAAVESMEEADAMEQTGCNMNIYDEAAKRQVLEIILRRFKEQHLQKKDILAEVDRGKMAPASRFIASVGYYNLINMFRLEYARLYTEANPLEKQAAVAEASGFASGSSFSKAKKSVKSIDPEIVSGVHL